MIDKTEAKNARRQIFTDTGQSTLKALLIVSGGAAAAFLAFLGTILDEPGMLEKLAPGAIESFADAIQSYIVSVALAVLTFGTTFFSHACYYLKHHDGDAWDKAGTVVMIATVFIGFLCIVFFLRGSFQAIHGFGLATNS